MVVVAGREKRRLVAHALLEVEAEDVAVEDDRTIEVGHLEMNMADLDTRIERRGHAERFTSGTYARAGSCKRASAGLHACPRARTAPRDRASPQRG